MISVCKCLHCKTNTEIVLIATPITAVSRDEEFKAHDYIWRCNRCKGMFYDMSLKGLNKTALEWAYRQKLMEQLNDPTYRTTLPAE